ncbi:MAG: cadherin repeat domain-containing protein [Chloroflexi bacterium]|nr:cadherin repeat domain-containing protein [Chloroflexota bacterium]
MRIAVANYGGIGQLVETFPADFTFVESSPSVTPSDRTLTFNLVGDTAVHYTLTAPAAAGRKSGFSGTLVPAEGAGVSTGGSSSVAVRSASSGGGSGFGGGGTSANQPPRVREGTTATRSVAENAEAGTPVGDRFEAFDNDSTTITYTLAGKDARRFAIDPETGQLSVAAGAGLDFEAKRTLTVTVSNVDDAGVVTLAPAAPAVGQLLSASLYEPDGDVTGVVWQWERSQDLATWLSAPGDGWTYTPSEADAGHYLRATVSYGDVHDANKRAHAVTAERVPAPPSPVPTATATATATSVPPAPTATAVATATATAVPPPPTATAIIVTPTPQPPAPVPTATATVAGAEDGGFPVWVGVLILLAALVLAGVVIFAFIPRR